MSQTEGRCCRCKTISLIIICEKNRKTQTASTLQWKNGKHGYISTVRPTVTSNPSRKRSLNWMNLKTPAYVLVWTENILKPQLFF